MLNMRGTAPSIQDSTSTLTAEGGTTTQDCPDCILPPQDGGGGSIDWDGAYTRHIASLDTPNEYTILRDTNGCTWSPDGNWTACCDMHDFAYADRGTHESEREEADFLLILDCMMRVGYTAATLANNYYGAVRDFGSGAFNWRNSQYACYYTGSEGLLVYGPGRYTNNPWGYEYPLGGYPYSDDCRSKGYT